VKKLLFLLLFVSGISFAQKIKPDLRTPYKTLFTHLYFLEPEHYNVANSALTIRGISKKEAQSKVIKLKEIYDGKGLVVDFSKVPKSATYKDTISSDNIETALYRYTPFPNQLPEVYLEKVGSRWYYSKETVAKIDKIHKETFLWEFTWLQKHYPDLFKEEMGGVKIWKPIGLIILIGVTFLLYLLLYPVIFFILKKIQKLFVHETYVKSVELLQKITRPLVFIIILEFVRKVLPTLHLYDLNSFLFLSFSIAETVFWVYIFLQLVDLVLMLYNDFKKKNYTKLDQQLTPILKKILKWIIILIGFLNVLTLFGMDPKTVLTGASIGGIAVAFAAQDSVKNLIGTIVIFLDKPFQLGDWVEIGNVVGTVEKVGLRSTRVRAADTSIFQIPNSKVSEADINNKGLRIYRRYQTELGIRYDTPPSLIQAFVDGIRKIVVAHPDTRSESYNVEFSGFGDSSLNVMVNVFFKKLDWGSEQSSKHRLHMAIVKLAAALGIEFAFPSSTLMIEQFPGTDSLATKYDTDKAKIEKKTRMVIEEFEKESEEADDPNQSTIPDVYSDMESD
jgi:MscS family membrane protein